MNRLFFALGIISYLLTIFLLLTIINDIAWIKSKRKAEVSKPTFISDKKYINIIVIIVYILTTVFSNVSILHMIGLTDIWSLRPGTYSYYADIHYHNLDTEFENDYYLPVELSVDEDGDETMYDITKIYFKNEGYVETANEEYVYDYKEPIEIYEIDYPVKTYTAYITNKKAPEHSGDSSLIYPANIIVLIAKLLILLMYISFYIYYLGYKANKGDSCEV